MDSVIITARIGGSAAEYDIDVSPNTPCHELARQIKDAIRLRDSEIVRRIDEKPYLSTIKGQRLSENVTLADMGLWDGSILILGSESL